MFQRLLIVQLLSQLPDRLLYQAPLGQFALQILQPADSKAQHAGLQSKEVSEDVRQVSQIGKKGFLPDQVHLKPVQLPADQVVPCFRRADSAEYFAHRDDQPQTLLSLLIHGVIQKCRRQAIATWHHELLQQFLELHELPRPADLVASTGDALPRPSRSSE